MSCRLLSFIVDSNFFEYYDNKKKSKLKPDYFN